MNKLPQTLIFLIACVGCQPRTSVHVESTQEKVSVQDSEQFQSLWEACLHVLRRHHFQIDRQDLRAGIITTHPQTSQHFFEFWRHDVATARDFFESNLQTVRRRVEITIEPGGAEDQYNASVVVHKDRLHMMERQINNPAAALRVFSVEVPSTQGEKIDSATDPYWTPEGEDPAMAQHLLVRILEEYQDANRLAQAD